MVEERSGWRREEEVGLEVSESASESGGERVGEDILGISEKCFFRFGFVTVNAHNVPFNSCYFVVHQTKIIE